MTLQAAVAVIGDLFVFGRLDMWIVAGDATELTFARLEAAAAVYLLHLADCLVIIGQVAGLDKSCPELMQGQAWPIIVGIPAGPKQAHHGRQVALLTDRLAQRWRQLGGVD